MLEQKIDILLRKIKIVSDNLVKINESLSVVSTTVLLKDDLRLRSDRLWHIKKLAKLEAELGRLQGQWRDELSIEDFLNE